MLSKLSGNTHTVHTGVAVCLLESGDRSKEFTKCAESTSVTFSDLPEEVIRAVSLGM